MQCAEDLVKTSVQHVLDTVHDDLEFFDLRVEKGLLARLEKWSQPPPPGVDGARWTYLECAEPIIRRWVLDSPA